MFLPHTRPQTTRPTPLLLSRSAHRLLSRHRRPAPDTGTSPGRPPGPCSQPLCSPTVLTHCRCSAAQGHPPPGQRTERFPRHERASGPKTPGSTAVSQSLPHHQERACRTVWKWPWVLTHNKKAPLKSRKTRQGLACPRPHLQRTHSRTRPEPAASYTDRQLRSLRSGTAQLEWQQVSKHGLQPHNLQQKPHQRLGDNTAPFSQSCRLQIRPSNQLHASCASKARASPNPGYTQDSQGWCCDSRSSSPSLSPLRKWP